MKGADIHTVALLLGHKDLRMAARYQHPSPTFLADAVRGLDAAFKECHHYVTRREGASGLIFANSFVLLASPTGFEPVLPP